MFSVRLLTCLIPLLWCGARVQAGTLAQFRTVFGDIEVQLEDQDKPVTVQNFIRYVQSGAYQDGFAHRLVPGFVVQGGGFTMTNRGTANPSILPIPTFAPITNEFGVGQRLSNVYGTIAMAKLGGDTNSATSQWFFNLTNNAFLDAPDTNNFFVVFGHVVRGTNILNTLSSFQYWDGSQKTNLVYNWGSPFNELPLLYPSLYDTNFFYIDVTLLQVQVSPAPGGGRQIAWNSAAAMTNVVEFTTNMPPIWTTLVRTNGTGSRVSVTDLAPAPGRFYRVRVEF
jgi:cyclophilin family peptidyl-prolyl cis-trans isomerase